MSRARTSHADPAAGGEAEQLAQAVRALAIGTATVDAAGNLLAVDDRFLGLHGVDHADIEMRGRLVGRLWSNIVQCPECRLAGEDASAVLARWSALLKSLPAAAGRANLRLSDGRTLEIAVTPAPGGPTVLAAKDSTDVATSGERRQLQSGFVHDVNNTLGGMLANLYLATTDIEAEHPARKWLDAVNVAAVELRARLREIAGTSAGKSAGNGRRR